jgi:hypothetical protein
VLKAAAPQAVHAALTCGMLARPGRVDGLPRAMPLTSVAGFLRDLTVAGKLAVLQGARQAPGEACAACHTAWHALSRPLANKVALSGTRRAQTVRKVC